MRFFKAIPEEAHAFRRGSFTVHFIGDVTAAAAERIATAFRNASLPEPAFPTPIQLGGRVPVKTFRKDIIFLDVKDMQGQLGRLSEWGKRFAPVDPAHPRYNPHITLARNPKGVPLSKLLKALNQQPFTSTFQPTELVLFDSRIVGDRTIYSSLVKRSLSEQKPGEKS